MSLSLVSIHDFFPIVLEYGAVTNENNISLGCSLFALKNILDNCKSDFIWDEAEIKKNVNEIINSCIRSAVLSSLHR